MAKHIRRTDFLILGFILLVLGSLPAFAQDRGNSCESEGAENVEHCQNADATEVVEATTEEVVTEAIPTEVATEQTCHGSACRPEKCEGTECAPNQGDGGEGDPLVCKDGMPPASEIDGCDDDEATATPDETETEEDEPEATETQTAVPTETEETATNEPDVTATSTEPAPEETEESESTKEPQEDPCPELEGDTLPEGWYIDDAGNCNPVNTQDINGRIHECGTGNAIPGATVTVTNTATGYSKTVGTGQDNGGYWTVYGFPDGPYTYTPNVPAGWIVGGGNAEENNTCFIREEEEEREIIFPPWPIPPMCTGELWFWPSPEGIQSGTGCDAVSWRTEDGISFGSQTFCPTKGGNPVFTHWVKAPENFWGANTLRGMGFTFWEDWQGHGPSWWKNETEGVPQVDCSLEQPTEEPTEPPIEPTPTPTEPSEPGNPGTGGGGGGGEKKTLCAVPDDPNFGLEVPCVSSTDDPEDNAPECVPQERILTDDRGKASDLNRETDINSYLVNDENGTAEVRFEMQLTANLAGNYSNPDAEDCIWAANLAKDEDNDGQDELSVEVRSYNGDLITGIKGVQNPAFCTNGECVIARNITSGELEVYDLDGELLQLIELDAQGTNPHAAGEYIVYTDEAGEIAFVSEDGETQCTSGFEGQRGTLLSDLSGFTGRGNDTVSRIFEVESFEVNAETPIAEEVVAVGGPNMIALDPDLSGHIAVNEGDTLEVLQSLSDETAEVFDEETRTRKLAWNDPEEHIATEEEKAAFTEWCEVQADSEPAKAKAAESSIEEHATQEYLVTADDPTPGDVLVRVFELSNAQLWGTDNVWEACAEDGLDRSQVIKPGDIMFLPYRCIEEFKAGLH